MEKSFLAQTCPQLVPTRIWCATRDQKVPSSNHVWVTAVWTHIPVVPNWFIKGILVVYTTPWNM